MIWPQGIGLVRCPGLLARLQPVLFHRLLNALSSFLACLCARGREITVLRSVQIGPGVQRRHIFRRIVLVG
jgi:hypothetical protein